MLVLLLDAYMTLKRLSCFMKHAGDFRIGIFLFYCFLYLCDRFISGYIHSGIKLE